MKVLRYAYHFPEGPCLRLLKGPLLSIVIRNSDGRAMRYCQNVSALYSRAGFLSEALQPFQKRLSGGK